MVEGWRGWWSTWEDVNFTVEEHREVDNENALADLGLALGGDE